MKLLQQKQKLFVMFMSKQIQRTWKKFSDVVTFSKNKHKMSPCPQLASLFLFRKRITSTFFGYGQDLNFFSLTEHPFGNERWLSWPYSWICGDCHRTTFCQTVWIGVWLVECLFILEKISYLFYRFHSVIIKYEWINTLCLRSKNINIFLVVE